MLGGGLGVVHGVVVVVVVVVGIEVVLEYGLELELELGPALTSERFVLPCRRRRRDYRTVAGIVAVGFGCSRRGVDSQQKKARRRRKRVGREG